MQPDSAKVASMPGGHDRHVALSRCRALLQKGGAPEAHMTDDEVRNLRDTLAALAEILLSTVGDTYQ